MTTRAYISSLAFTCLAATAVRAQTSLYDLPGQPSDRLGRGLSTIDDLDGDGLPDFVVGAPNALNGFGINRGVVRVFSSKTGQVILTLNAPEGGFANVEGFGWSVLGIPDANGDGKPDIVVGAPRTDWFGQTDIGFVFVFSGATGAQLMQDVGEVANGRRGWSLCNVGDWTGDGKNDFAVGAPEDNYFPLDASGCVVIYNGQTLAQAFGAGNSAIVGLQVDGQFGHSIDAVPDINGDGRPEIIIGAPDHDILPATDAGIARVYARTPAGFVLLNEKSGTTTNAHVGTAVCGIADVNGDGLGEFALGEPDYTGPALYSGRVRVFSGSNFALLRTFLGTGQQDFLGNSIAGAGDFDNDGRGDIIVGAFGYDNAPGAFNGRADVYAVQSGATLTSWVGYQSFGGMGSTVASAGDLNNDGATDVMAGAPFDGTYNTGAGYVRVHLGQAPFPTNYCTAKVNSLGCTPGITYGGAASLSLGAGLAVVGVNVVPGENGLMIWSNTTASLPFFGGTLCVGAPIKRTPVQSTSTNASYPCTGQYYFQVSQAFMAAEGLSAGQDFYAQFWSRDTGFAAPNNVGLTNGLQARIVP